MADQSGLGFPSERGRDRAYLFVRYAEQDDSPVETTETVFAAEEIDREAG